MDLTTSFEALANGVQLCGAFILAKATLFQRLERIYNRGAARIGSFAADESGLTVAGRGEVSTFLGEWAEVLAGLGLVAIGFGVQAGLTLSDAEGRRLWVGAGWLGAVALAALVWCVSRIVGRNRLSRLEKRRARERRTEEQKAQEAVRRDKRARGLSTTSRRGGLCEATGAGAPDPQLEHQYPELNGPAAGRNFSSSLGMGF